MSKELFDTYFLDSKEALRIALQKNRVSTDNINVDGLQICYYSGKKLKKSPINCINVPIKKIVKYFSNTKNRFPKDIDFTKSKYKTIEQQQLFKDAIETIFIEVDKTINAKISRKVYNIRKLKLNFNGEVLRVFVPACRETTVMQHVARSISNMFKNLGYDVLFDIQNDMQDCRPLPLLKKLYKFNPHIIININHINNSYLSKDVFNFVWFQDPVSVLVDDSKIVLRERDYIFSLLSEFDNLLQAKNISFLRQSFCINSKEYKQNNSIKRKKKIVFIGSSYLKMLGNGEFDKKLLEHLITLFEQGVIFTYEVVNNILNQFNVDKMFLTSTLIPFIIRDRSVRWLCNTQTKYDIEIYGWGWDVYDDVKPYFKGALDYGSDIADVYNSAEFVLAPHQHYILQQRVLEASACGCIPIVYDIRDLTDENIYPEALCYFKTFSDLEDILNSKTPIKKDSSKLLKDNSYKAFAKKIIKIVKKELKNAK